MPLPRIVRPLQQSVGLRRLWPGQIGALLAAELHLVVIAWLALELTGSGVALGTVLGIGLLPRIVFTLSAASRPIASAIDASSSWAMLSAPW